MDKKLALKLNGGRQVIGILRGFDPFMNLVVDETIEECKDGSKKSIGMVVCYCKTILDDIFKVAVFFLGYTREQHCNVGGAR